MKKWIAIFLVLSASCDFDNQDDSVEYGTPQRLEKSTDDLIGKWELDSSIFVNNGSDGEYEPPLIPTYWIFSENGDYTVENSMMLSGHYTRENNQFIVECMGVSTDYEIIQLDNQKLQIESTVYEIDTTNLKMRSYLTKSITE